MLKIAYHVLWLVGALFVVYFGNEAYEHAEQVTRATYHVQYSMRIVSMIAVLSGIYLGLIRGIPARIRFSWSHLLVFAVSLILVLYYTLSFDLKLRFTPLLLDFYRYNGLFMVGIICGLSLCIGLIGVKKDN